MIPIWNQHKWVVCKPDGRLDEIVATFATVTPGGALHFNIVPTPTEPSYMVAAYSPDHWSQMHLIDLPTPNESEGVSDTSIPPPMKNIAQGGQEQK